jgi:hypothetical protein
VLPQGVPLPLGATPRALNIRQLCAEPGECGRVAIASVLERKKRFLVPRAGVLGPRELRGAGRQLLPHLLQVAAARLARGLGFFGTRARGVQVTAGRLELPANNSQLALDLLELEFFFLKN